MTSAMEGRYWACIGNLKSGMSLQLAGPGAEETFTAFSDLLQFNVPLKEILQIGLTIPHYSPEILRR